MWHLGAEWMRRRATRAVERRKRRRMIASPTFANEVRNMNETGGIGRRDFGIAIATSALVVLASCNEGSGDGPSADSELSALAEAISSLGATVRRFKDEDWKDVVPEVETDASDIADAFANLKAAMGKK
jgi:hypothetical protein